MPLTGDDILLVERHADEGYAVVTINREERANSISLELAARLGALWPQLRDDRDIRAIVLTGVGSRFFSTGNDLKDTAALGDRFAEVVADRDLRVTPAEHGVWKPVIAAVNGAALAGGFLLAQMCDVRIAAESAVFGIPEVRWSMPAPFVAELQRLLPPAVARELALWGTRQLDARRMHALGFVNEVVPAGAVLPAARRWAAEVALMAPAAIRAHKELMHRALMHDAARLAAWSTELLDPVTASNDAVEGPRAFAEGRAPRWATD